MSDVKTGVRFWFTNGKIGRAYILLRKEAGLVRAMTCTSPELDQWSVGSLFTNTLGALNAEREYLARYFGKVTMEADDATLCSLCTGLDSEPEASVVTTPVSTYPAPSLRSIRDIQTDLPWNGTYSEAYYADPRPHKDFDHAWKHIVKACGKLFDMMDAIDHGGVVPADTKEKYGKYLADVLYCGLRCANTFPGGPLDAQSALEDRIGEKGPGEKACAVPARPAASVPTEPSRARTLLSSAPVTPAPFLTRNAVASFGKLASLWQRAYFELAGSEQQEAAIRAYRSALALRTQDEQSEWDSLDMNQAKAIAHAFAGREFP